MIGWCDGRSHRPGKASLPKAVRHRQAYLFGEFGQALIHEKYRGLVEELEHAPR
jgi:hypothetical protein